MKRRIFSLHKLASLLLVAPVSSATAAGKPNVLFLAVDDLRPHPNPGQPAAGRARARKANS